jgi:hypothetical protein
MASCGLKTDDLDAGALCRKDPNVDNMRKLTRERCSVIIAMLAQ